MGVSWVSLSHTHTHTYTHTHIHTLRLPSLSLFCSLFLSLSFSLSHTHTHTHNSRSISRWACHGCFSLSLSLSHTHTHTHTLLSLRLGVTLWLGRQIRPQWTNNAATISRNGLNCGRLPWVHCCWKCAAMCNSLQRDLRCCPRRQGLFQCASIWIQTIRPKSRERAVEFLA